jgi:hypothetical protein
MANVIERLESRAYLSAAALATPVQFAVGVDPVAIATGDFNGDGKTDIVTANASGSISILLNTGNGTFASAQTIQVGTRPTSVAIGDFNGDGKPDLAVVDAARGEVDIFLNRGNGTFGSPTTYVYGTAPGASADPDAEVVTGNFTTSNDFIDLAIADNTDDKIAVLLNNGTGTFAAPIDTSFENISQIAAGNFTGNRLTDLAVTATGASKVFTLLSDGTGTFEAPIPQSLTGQPTALAVGEFDGSTNQDLAVATTGNSGNAIDVELGSGSGTFTSNSTLSITGSIGAISVGAFFNSSSGNSTGFASIDTSGNLTVFQNNGAGTFTAGQTLTGSTSATTTTTASANATEDAATADFNGDGSPDLAVIESPAMARNSDSAGEVEIFFSQAPAAGFNSSLSGALPISAVSGSKTRLSQVLTLANNTTKTISGRTTINLYLSTTTTLAAGASPVLSLTKSLRLLPGVSAAFLLSLKTVPSVAAGSYFLVATASTTSGSSTIAASSRTIALGAPFIDLAALSLNAPASARVGRHIAVALKIQNTGNARVNRAVPISIGISTSPTGAAATTLATFAPRVSLTPGEKRTGTLVVRLPISLPVGTYYLVGTVDPNNALGQPNTANNTAISRRITVR